MVYSREQVMFYILSIVQKVSKLKRIKKQCGASLVRAHGVTDLILLYKTLLADGVIPVGFVAEFLELESSLRRAVERKMKRLSTITDAEAELQLEATRKFRTKWQQACYEGPTARQDAETAEPSRWITLLADILRNTDTPMRRLLRENRPIPSCWKAAGGQVHFVLVSGSFRSSSLGLQRLIRLRFHFTGNISLSILCTLVGALRAWVTESATHFLQNSPGGSGRVQDKLADDALYDVTRKELLASALLGKPPRQAPRYLTVLLAALEDNVMSLDTLTFGRVMSWWLLLGGAPIRRPPWNRPSASENF